MMDTYKCAAKNQIHATLCMLSICVDRCPDDLWCAAVVNLKFCQVAFHTLIYTDLYLDQDEAAFRQQPFHHTHADTFADYEELEDRVQQQSYRQDFVDSYLRHCRDKATSTIDAETPDSLTKISPFLRRQLSRAEMHQLIIRHLQHHTSQLSLHLKSTRGIDVPWIGSGWQDAAPNVDAER